MKIVDRLLSEYGHPELVRILSEELPATVLNSLLLEVFHKRTQGIKPSTLLEQYGQNRFVHLSNAPFFPLLELKFRLLQQGQYARFDPVQLSPVSPLGTCSVMGFTHQNKVLSATRGTEVIADATNVMALESAMRRRQNTKDVIRLCSVHRHIRTQVFDFEGFSPHFDVFCMTSAGKDTGNYTFEAHAFAEHIRFYHEWSKNQPGASGFIVKITPYGAAGEKFSREQLAPMFSKEFLIEILPANSESGYYYQFLRSKIYLSLHGTVFEVGDCGFTDWTQRILSDKKERFFISGLGLELIAKMLHRGGL